MTNAIAKILLELTASDHSASELRQFFSFVEQEGARSLINRIQHLREHPALDADIRSNPSRSGRTSTEKRNLEVARDVEALLLGSANLTKSHATDILLSELLKRYPAKELPSHNKVAFQTWVSRLADSISPSELLHISSRIRNDIVHGNKRVSDWPIGDM